MPGRRAVYFHNITPPNYAETFSAVQAFEQALGYADMAMLAACADVAMAPSDYSAAELIAAGYRRVTAVPLPLNLDRLHPRAASPQPSPHLLFVGRLAPHKRQEELIRVLAALHGTGWPDATLTLIGGSAMASYDSALRRWAHQLGVASQVAFLSGVSDAQLAAAYAAATVFVCSSDHEGFCVPVLEAMAFSLPVIAYADGATRETVGDGGLILEHRDPLVWAQLVSNLQTDPAARARLIESGRRRLRDFNDAIVMDRLVAALGLPDARGGSTEGSSRPAEHEQMVESELETP
ncbi:MAG: glycosyltransferase [Candidatus Dormibacteraeota bacterium]|nr:glycosyltransferase [Candidatus Dormibacteraeota bacterium]